MKKIRKFLVLIMAVSMILGMASVAEAKWFSITGTGWNYMGTVTTTKGKQAQAYVGTSGSRYGLDILFTDTNGNRIWGENNAVAANSSRVFYLGSDHKYYKIYIRQHAVNLLNQCQNGNVNVSNCYSFK